MSAVPPRRIRSLIVALVTATLALLVVTGSPALGEALRRTVVDPVAAARLEALAQWEQAALTFEQAGARADEFYVAADAAAALGQEVRRSGWDSPRIPDLVRALAATANADGGYGLAREWDAYQDGSVNPAATSYAATTAGHVGPILLSGYVAGAVNAGVVNRAIDSILDLPRAPGDACIPYSASPNDLGKACVWNVHFGAASWVRRASAATGHRSGDAAALVASALSVLDRVAPDPATGYLPYSSTQTKPQDIGHQIWTAVSIDDLRGNTDMLNHMISKPLWREQVRRFRDYNVASAVSHIALFDCRYATDTLVLKYAGSTARGNPYAFKALAARARAVAAQCFTADGRATASRTNRPGWGPPGSVQVDLG